MVTDDYITVKLPGTEKNKRLKGPLFQKRSDYQTLIEQHKESKIPKFLTPDESQAQQAKLALFTKERSDFNHKRYLSPRPGARRANRRSKVGVGVKAVGDSTKTSEGPDLKTISSKQQKQLKDIKATTQEKASSADLLAKQIVSKALGTDSEKVKSPSPSDASTLDSGTASLDAQIGSLSLQYHLLLVQLAGAKGQRAQRIKAQVIVIEQKLAALNAELEKTKANQNKKKNEI
jgi:hypothetical protein